MKSNATATTPPGAAVGLLVASLALSACTGSSIGSNMDTSREEGESAGPTVSFSASSTVVSPGGSTTLSWTSTDASSCTASGAWSGSKSTAGSETVGPIAADSSYTLSCSGEGGGAVQTLAVQVDDGSGPQVSLSASPLAVASGGTSTLSWTSSGATSCSASGGWTGTQPASGSFAVGPLNASTTYQLTCTGPSGNAISAVTVSLVDRTLRWQPPTSNADGSPLVDLAGFVIYWGESSRNYTGSATINSPTATEWDATVPPGDYFFAMTAFDSENHESAYSNEVLKSIP